MDVTRAVLSGSVGFFWPQDDLKTDLSDAVIERGYVQQADDTFVELTALDEAEVLPGISMKGPARPLAIFGSTEKTGILLPELMSTRRTGHWGGAKASVRRYRARALLTDVDVWSAKSHHLTSASLTFAEGLDFAGLSALHTDLTHDPVTHVLTEAKFTLKSAAALSGGRYRGFEVTLEPDWTTSKSGAVTNLTTGLAITLTAKKPQPFGDFRHLLLGIQDLINLAYDRFVPAQSGRAVVDGADPDRNRSRMWIHDTMIEPSHRQGIVSTPDSRPMFWLADIGGTAGLRRWLTLRDRFPDVAQVISSGHRYGGSRQPSRLLEVSAAIEFYVAANRKAGAAWAKKSKKAPTPADALAQRVGKPFVDMVGDSAVWADRLQTTYNAVKHDPSFARDPEELRLLSWSAQVLLLSALLDRAALTKTPSRRIITDYRLEGGQKALRTLLGT